MNKTELRQYAGSITYNKGLEIYNSNNKILNFEVAKTDDSDYVHASVKGSRGNYYGVSLDIDWDFETIEGCFCSCPAFQNYDELCKHCIAVALKYIDYANVKSKKKNTGKNNNSNLTTIQNAFRTGSIEKNATLCSK